MANPVSPDDSLLNDYFGSIEPSWTADETVDGRRIVTVPVTKLYGDSLYGKQRGVRVDQGTNAWLRLVLYSQVTGGPLIITVGQYSSPPTVAVRYREATGQLPCTYDGEDATLASDGRSVVLPIPAELRDCPGVYRGQVRVVDATGEERVRDEFLLLVERGMWLTDGTSPGNDRGPPTVLEIQTATRDHPSANRLLGNYAWDAAEIGTALVAAVQQYNSEFPPLPRGFATTTFPIAWRRPWIDGALAHLFEIAAEYHRRGHLPYDAAGLKVDDLAKEKDYAKAAQFYAERFVRFVRLKRSEQNIAAAWGSLGSGGYIRT